MTYSEKLKDPKWNGKSGIYRLVIGDGFYIGSAVLLTKRLRQHLVDLRAGRHVNIHLQRAFNKHGTIDCEVIELVEDASLLIAREQHYIDNLRPRYNIAPIAGSQLGFRHSEASRKLISEVQKGKKMSLETRQRMSEARKGLKFTAEHRARMAESKRGEKNPFFRAGSRHPQFGIPKSAETKARMAATSRLRGSHAGRRNKSARTGVLYDVETGENFLFRSLRPLCRYLNIDYRGMHSALKGERFYMGRYYVSYNNLPAHVMANADHSVSSRFLEDYSK